MKADPTRALNELVVQKLETLRLIDELIERRIAINAKSRPLGKALKEARIKAIVEATAALEFYTTKS
jgi:hypothetical protein